MIFKYLECIYICIRETSSVSMKYLWRLAQVRLRLLYFMGRRETTPCIYPQLECPSLLAVKMHSLIFLFIIIISQFHGSGIWTGLS